MDSREQDTRELDNTQEEVSPERSRSMSPSPMEKKIDKKKEALKVKKAEQRKAADPSNWINN